MTITLLQGSKPLFVFGRTIVLIIRIWPNSTDPHFDAVLLNADTSLHDK